MNGQSAIIPCAAGALLAFIAVATLVIAKGLILPIVASLVFMLVLVRAADWLGKLPVLRLLSATFRRALVLAVLAAVTLLIGLLIAGMIDRITAALPVYEQNIETLFASLSVRFGLDEGWLWDQAATGAQDVFDLRKAGLLLLGSAESLVETLALILLYTGFIIAERGALQEKLSRAIGDHEKTRRVRDMALRIGNSVSDYLVTKSLINLMLSVLSFPILWLFGVDFALFWAVVIGLLNFIPYLGSIIGVFLPVLQSLGQFGSLQDTFWLAVALIAIQAFVGSLLEPWLLGWKVNLSPFVVIVSVSIWTWIWGLAGAVLAVPLTSTLVIACGEIPALRPVAVLLTSGTQRDA